MRIHCHGKAMISDVLFLGILGASRVHLTNIRGLHSNLNWIHHHFETAKPHLLLLTETQIRPPADSTYLHYTRYTLHNFKQRAGLCLYIRDDVCCQRLRYLENLSFSIIWVLVESGQCLIIYGSVYRSHSTAVTRRRFGFLSTLVTLPTRLNAGI